MGATISQHARGVTQPGGSEEGGMAGDQPVPWEPCGRDGCGGVRLVATACCLAHAAEQDPPAFQAELKRIGAKKNIHVLE